MPTPHSPYPFLAEIPDWRHSKNKKHSWETLWTLILVGLLSGSENILALSQWLNNHAQPLKQYLGLNTLPQQATIYRFFWVLEEHLPALQKALLSWVKAHSLLQDKTLIHLRSAFSCKNPHSAYP